MLLHPNIDENLGHRRLSLLGLFAHDLAIRPWEIGRLPVREFRALAHWVEEFNRREGG